MNTRCSDRIRRHVGTARALVLASLVLLGLPALCVAQPPAASEQTPAATAANASLLTAQGTPQPLVPANTPLPTPAPARELLPLALVLPLDSPIYGRAAEAVRAGFAAAAAAAATRFNLIAHGDGGVVAAFAKAKEDGARVVVGPLVRDDLKSIVAAGADLPWTIALNQLDDGTALPARVYTLALAVESEAVQLARRAQAEGARTLVVVTTGTPLQQRFAAAFTGEWALLGGTAPVTFRFDPSPDMLALLRREVAKAAPDAVLLAVNAQDAALAKPYLGQVQAYTSSQVNDRQPAEALRDLDDVRFVDVPWVADPASPEFAGIARPDYANTMLDRLYALGIDAFRVAQAFADGAPARLAFDGATGHLVLNGSHQFVREGTLLQFRDGEIVPAASR